jgi:hypothetical protein
MMMMMMMGMIWRGCQYDGVDDGERWLAEIVTSAYSFASPGFYHHDDHWSEKVLTTDATGHWIPRWRAGLHIQPSRVDVVDVAESLHHLLPKLDSLNFIVPFGVPFPTSVCAQTVCGTLAMLHSSPHCEPICTRHLHHSTTTAVQSLIDRVHNSKLDASSSNTILWLLKQMNEVLRAASEMTLVYPSLKILLLKDTTVSRHISQEILKRCADLDKIVHS